MVGFSEGLVGLVDVADAIQERLIGFEIGPDQRTVLVKRGSKIRLGVVDFPVDVDQFRGVLRLRQCVGDNESHGIADMTGFAITQQRNVFLRVMCAVRLLEFHQVGDRAKMRHVACRENQMNTFRSACGIEITKRKARSGMGRAQDICAQFAVGPKVIGKGPLAHDQLAVFLAQRRCAHAEFRCRDVHGNSR